MKGCDSIRIYVADYKKLGLSATWETLLPCLTDAERDKALRYRFEADRIRSVAGAMLIKAGVLKAYPGEKLCIDTTELGKPYVRDHSGYEFNLSHSGSIIAFAEDYGPVGVDVERIKDKDWKIFHRYLTPEEISMIENADDPERSFFEVWTIREAFAKEEGLGLQILDRDFFIDYDRNEIDYDGRTLQFRSFDHIADEKYKVSVCSPHDLSEYVVTDLSITDWEDCISNIRTGKSFLIYQT